MKRIDLRYRENSEVGYTISHFPDGEVQISLEGLDMKERYEVSCRVTSAEDLFLLCQVADILRRHELEFSLKIYYLMGMRMDRVISFTRPFTLKIVAGAIDNLGASEVMVYSPHSSATKRIFKKTKFRSEMLSGISLAGLFAKDNYTVIFPDDGAYKRYNIFNMASTRCEKVRDLETGRIVSMRLLEPERLCKANKVIVVDDLCDGGRTFIEVEKLVRGVNPAVEISLYVDHAVNRSGIEAVSTAYDKVYITDSYADWKNLPSNVQLIKLV